MSRGRGSCSLSSTTSSSRRQCDGGGRSGLFSLCNSSYSLWCPLWPPRVVPKEADSRDLLVLLAQAHPNKECYFKLFSTQIVILTLFSTRIIIFTLFSTLNIIVTLFSTQIIFLTLSSTQIVILKLRQKAVTAVDHDRRHWKAAKVTFYHFFHYSERGQTSEENNEN